MQQEQPLQPQQQQHSGQLQQLKPPDRPLLQTEQRAAGSSSSSSRRSSSSNDAAAATRGRGRWRSAAPLALLLLGVLLLLTQPAPSLATHVHATKQMRDHIQAWASQILVDRDYLGDASDHLRVAWSHDLGLPINATLAALGQLAVPITVDVKLVGFAGDGNEGLFVGEHDLQLYLKSLANQLESVALHPAPGRLPLRPEVEFRVQPAYYELAPKLWAAINQGVNVGHTSNFYGPYLLHMVDYASIDQLIEEDYDAHGEGVHTLYLLNPPAHQPYAYVYPQGIHDADFCPGSLWTGDKRYAWFDLTANLTFYGPGPGGKGQVFAHSTPIVKHYKPESRARAILPDLSALVWSACQHLVWPPVHHAALAYHKQLEVHLIYMVEGLSKPSPGDGRVDVSQLHQELQSIGDLIQQEVTVSEHTMLFAECDHCVTAFSGSLKSKTSRQAGAKDFKLVTSHYIDLPDLERWLSEWREVLLSEAGINWDEHSSRAILPVFIFDLPMLEPVLLDGVLQAASLGTGDVVAIRSTARPIPTFYGCFEHQMTLNPKSIHRPVLGAVLQAAYGVADTSLFWSPATGKGWNFVWSVGQTPFGPLSNIPTLSFAQRDAAVRNLALSYLNSSVSAAAALLRGFEWLAPYDSGTQHVKAFLQPEQVVPYHQRISLLLFKLQEAARALGTRQHALALGYAAATVHDVTALHKIVRRYKSTLDPDLVCMGEAQQSRWWALVGGCAFITLVLVVWRFFRGSDDGEPMMGGSAHSSRRGSLTDTLARIKSPVGGMRGF